MSDHETDVLVIGGGPAGTWAAVSAAQAGARVILVDKARCGASGPTAFGRTSLWHIPPGPVREEAVRRAYAHGGHLGDPDRIHRVLDETYRRVEEMLRRGYRFRGEHGRGALRLGLDGASYLRAMRHRLTAIGVRVLDHHPALQLLTDADGVVAGATGVRQGDHYRPWTVRAGAVVIATGGCAFLSGRAGTDVDTGDGLLLAVEAGAELSGMEFSSAYGLTPAVTTPAAAPDPALGLAMHVSTFYDESGAELTGHRAEAFAAIAMGRRVYAALDDAPEGLRCRLSSQGVVDGARRIPLRAVLEGTVRGAGGLRISAADCATTVPGLFGAGDAATREAIIGAVSGVGGQRGGWAIASGVWAGAGAARFARTSGTGRTAAPVPGAGLRDRARIDPRAVIGLVQEHTLPLRRSYWRSAGSLRDSIAELDAMWPAAEFELGGRGADRLRARQAAALLAVARWTKYSALARTETRGIHRRTDHPGVAENWRVRLRTGGLDEVWVRQESRPADAAPGDHDLSHAGRRLAGQESVLAMPPRPAVDVSPPAEAGRAPAGQEAVPSARVAASSSLEGARADIAPVAVAASAEGIEDGAPVGSGECHGSADPVPL
ncbi:FAD-dependent oxidoreductase [Nocardia arizonensis]|uniref:FAD-dependent oxidoreductase n=1 Tax=Nocardia arizonensis TaxID=1141647 RepID=UPI0009E8F09C|nr:FAD-binding protein [Nocardia arizonensis]